MQVDLNYCQVCGKWLGMDDYDGICGECDNECDTCSGEGRLEDYSCFPDAFGQYPTFQCRRCNGTGKEPEQEAAHANT